ncbi:MAG: FliA/WhiG family RNA polymerase sigma factor [Solirubrobacteraceae bacterium]|nr:FliA/WhiG family RNA polymerase sigma factor [Solirubrobacteraceae bacterium]
MVKYAAGSMKSRMPAHVDVADLISYGLGGLIDAVERFDPDRGATFETFAITRIRGAIVDELRKLDWVPRSVRAEARAIDQATSELSCRLQRVPTDAEMATKLSMTAVELDASLLRVAESRLISLDEPHLLGSAEGSERAMVDTVGDPDAPDPAASADAAESRALIATAITKLSERSQVVVALRYNQELSLGEIGEVLSLTESRVSQIHAAAVLQLRALLPARLADTS